MNFTFLEIIDYSMLQKVFEFRYKVFLEIYPQYLQNSGFTDNIEYDRYDSYAIHFAALDEKNAVCATVRLIHHSPIGYPTENGMIFDKNMFERDKLAEMSRIFVDAKYRNLKTTKLIIEEVKKFMYVKMLKLGIEYSYGSLEKSFLRLLRIYKMRYDIIGEVQNHGEFGLRYPCILYTKVLGNDNPELLKFWR
ncbi:MAG: GNAT family N-acetyltransferase [Sulfurimonas sp. RIFOXYD12_FULL_33_39]|uniref:GNAT family N-acyltransferase n=1 Tax=unclassified Sulfurimonas TaxID=2623549 RepID=UPI0008BE3C33|nr:MULTISPECIES: GNAT family N-acyltransferase [unclassified Sulfurimonas]OHE04767.1 MAG: GNAT family N-acetyltransferase [Sulfurimonas sp. RIFCSPLOWO2_12_FULL_34_6]OHE10780.1 MAG: GNAT family N-acetyltransferase [Sulfurimonas sp. RIFOXYD12_FULL_33_39]OHE13450.1 MAG: GNAT family N-acetyltransferase [Sulfurimonas sp. RIFOXYD2_FULL_34_21]